MVNNTSKDSYGRTIDYLRISVTDRCNLRCIYCMPEEGLKLFPHDEILSYEEILTIAKLSTELGVTKVRITGGEPLIRKNLTYLIERLALLDNIKDIALTTNGVLLSRMLNDLVSAGLRRINISLDTLNPEKFHRITRSGHLKDVLGSIDKCLEKNITPVKINMVVIKGLNDDEIIDFAAMTKHPAIHVRFIEYMPWGIKDFWNIEKVVRTKEIQDIVEKRLGPLTPDDSESMGPAKNYRIQEMKGIVGFINPVSEHFCALCNRIRLTADGKIRMCLFSDQEIDIKQPLRSGASPDALRAILVDAISRKPEKHQLLQHVSKHCREMSQIGG